jgi:exodeoxyribonuclease VIII
VHTLDTLDVEIALATLPMDFDIYDIPGGIYRRAKEIVQKKKARLKSGLLRCAKPPGILDYSRAAIFALIRDAAEDVHHFRRFCIDTSTKVWLKATTKHQLKKPWRQPDTLPEASWENEVKELVAAAAETSSQTSTDRIANLGGGVLH